MNHIIKGIIDSSIDLLYPKHCVSCDKVLLKIEKEMGFCKACAKKIQLVGPNYCMTCGVPVNEDEQYCNTCQNTKHYFDQNRAIFRYTGDMKDAMYRFKYANRRCYGKTFVWHAMKIYGNWIKEMDFDVIIPVPMYEKKKRKRGYNQAEVYAKAVSAHLHIPVFRDAVRRVRNTAPMKELDARGRRNNLKKAFIIAKNDVKFKCVLIIDDIYTTGSTIDEIAHEFRMAGVQKIYCLTLAIGQTT